MAEVKLSHIKKSYGDVEIVKDFDLDIRDKEFMVFVGPSGCGKSTTLRMIAGLEDITGGDLLIGGRRVNNVSPKDRDIAMVFQNYALYPHMTVYENMAFSLKLRQLAKGEIQKKVGEAARVLQLESLLGRKPKELSGGQRQRVAMGRALVRNPSVFLLDEPLSNLDAKLRVSMRTEIARLHQRLQTTMIYVTHDQTEAMTLGDRIVVMNDGIIQQCGTPMELYQHPVNQFVAGFIGNPPMNFFSVELMENEGRLFASSESILIEVPQQQADILRAAGEKEIVFGIRPEAIHDAAMLLSENIDIAARGTVEVVALLGAETLLHVRCGRELIVASMPSGKSYHPGDTIELVFTTDRMHAFRKADGRSLLYGKLGGAA